jgi:hypothetical protein
VKDSNQLIKEKSKGNASPEKDKKRKKEDDVSELSVLSDDNSSVMYNENSSFKADSTTRLPPIMEDNEKIGGDNYDNGVGLAIEDIYVKHVDNESVPTMDSLDYHQLIGDEPIKKRQKYENAKGRPAKPEDLYETKPEVTQTCVDMLH